MAWKLRYNTLIIWLFIGLFFGLLYVLVISLPSSSSSDTGLCPCANNLLTAQPLKPIETASQTERGDTRANPSSHRLAVIVPFRDRFDELTQFVPHMNHFLKKQNIDHEIFVVNQVDEFRFNRASLINVGFLHISSTNKFDYLVMHDVDLLPLNPQLKYDYRGEGVAFHIASPKLHPKYHYDTFVGGILLLTLNDFRKLNGLSNKYWGWGLEDDEFYLRMKQGNVTVSRPENITTGPENSFSHVHDRSRRKRDQEKCYDQKAVSRKRDRVSGVNDVAYKIESISNMTFNGAPATLINVALVCNKTKTPWCRCP